MILSKIQIFQKSDIVIQKENQTTTELDFMVWYLSNEKQVILTRLNFWISLIHNLGNLVAKQ